MELKYYVKTSQGTFGPFDSQYLAESQSATVPKLPNEVPQIVQLTEDRKQILFG